MLQNHRYCIVGSGRTARHFSYYFQNLDLAFSCWDRSQPLAQLQELLPQSSHVLLLISDSAIENFFREHLQAYQGRLVHFSGALEIAGIQSTHPLMSFATEFYDLETYQKIPFVTTSDLPASDLLPGLTNPFVRILPELKAYYHARCLMSGNFTTLLWQKMRDGLSHLGLPPGIENVYRDQIFKNLSVDLSQALTGPLVRRDLATVIRNDQALKNDPYQNIYRAFVKVHFPEAIPHLEAHQ
jgi:hypothetical protein